MKKSQSNLQLEWDYASEHHGPENEDRVDEDQYVPKQQTLSPATAYRARGISSALADSATFQQNSKPAPIKITPGRGQCIMTCGKCGKTTSKTKDIVAHRC